MVKQSCLMITLASLFFQVSHASSCSLSKNALAEKEQLTDFHTNSLYQDLTPNEQQLLVGAITTSVEELYQQTPRADQEALFKRILNDPKVLDALGSIQTNHGRNKENYTSESFAKELDVLTVSIIQQTITTHTRSRYEASPTTTALMTITYPTELEAKLRSEENELHLSKREYRQLIQTQLITENNKSDSLELTLASAFHLTIPTKHKVLQAHAVSNHSTMVATGDNEGLVTVRSLHDGRKVFSFTHKQEVTCCAFAPDDSFLAVATGAGCTLWSLQTGQKLAEKTYRCPITQLLINPQGTTITSTHRMNIITQWNWQTNVEQIISFQQTPILAISYDQTYCAVYHDQTTRIVRISDQALLATLATGNIFQGLFGYDNNSFITLSKNRDQVCIWNISAGTETRFAAETSTITDLSLARTAEKIIFGLADGTVWCVNYDAKGCYWKQPASIADVSLSANGQRVASLARDGSIVVADLAQDNLVYTEVISKKRAQNQSTIHFTLTADGNYLVRTREQGKSQKSMLTINMFDQPALTLVKDCSSHVLELIAGLTSLTILDQTTKKKLLAPKEKVKLTAYQTALFRQIPDFIKQVLLRTNRILITPTVEEPKAANKTEVKEARA